MIIQIVLLAHKMVLQFMVIHAIEVTYMKYGYCRVSSYIQLKGYSLEDQKQKLIAAGVPEENIFMEKYTGRTTDRPVFQELISRLRPGDELVCTKLDRFARSVVEGLITIRQLVDKKVFVNILNMGRIDDSPVGNFILTMMLAFAQFERDMIKERTAAGKLIARQQEGYHEGHPRISKAKIKHALDLLVSNSYSQVAKMTGISKSTLIRYERERKAKELERLKAVPRKPGCQGPEDELTLDLFPNKRPGRPKKSR